MTFYELICDVATRPACYSDDGFDNSVYRVKFAVEEGGDKVIGIVKKYALVSVGTVWTFGEQLKRFVELKEVLSETENSVVLSPTTVEEELPPRSHDDYYKDWFCDEESAKRYAASKEDVSVVKTMWN